VKIAAITSHAFVTGALNAPYQEFSTMVKLSRNGSPKPPTALPHAIATLAPPGSPLRFMLDVMHDETAAPTRRDRMAIASAQYIHQRAVDTRVPKKDIKQAAARDVGGPGSVWETDLDADFQRQ
jgi:hypothetical protein